MSEHDSSDGPEARLDVDDDDERLLTALAEADAPPPELAAAARALYTWRTVDAELAELAYDSEADEQALAGVRGAGELRQLTFECESGVRVSVEVTSGPPARLVGQVEPSGLARIEVRSPASSVVVDTDEHGRFTVADLQPGPMSLRCTHPGAGGAFETGWVVL